MDREIHNARERQIPGHTRYTGRHEYAEFLIIGLATQKSINPARMFFCIKFVFTISFTEKCTLIIHMLYEQISCQKTYPTNRRSY